MFSNARDFQGAESHCSPNSGTYMRQTRLDVRNICLQGRPRMLMRDLFAVSNLGLLVLNLDVQLQTVTQYNTIQWVNVNFRPLLQYTITKVRPYRLQYWHLKCVFYLRHVLKMAVKTEFVCTVYVTVHNICVWLNRNKINDGIYVANHCVVGSAMCKSWNEAHCSEVHRACWMVNLSENRRH